MCQFQCIIVEKILFYITLSTRTLPKINSEARGQNYGRQNNACRRQQFNKQRILCYASFNKQRRGIHKRCIWIFKHIFQTFDEIQPEYCAVCFDVHQPTFRHKMFGEYKGTRKGMPEELRPQMPLLKKVLQAMNITTCELGGYEADDL